MPIRTLLVLSPHASLVKENCDTCVRIVVVPCRFTVQSDGQNAELLFVRFKCTVQSVFSSCPFGSQRTPVNVLLLLFVVHSHTTVESSGSNAKLRSTYHLKDLNAQC